MEYNINRLILNAESVLIIPNINHMKSFSFLVLIVCLFINIAVVNTQCPKHCLNCMSPTICTNCNIGYYLNFNYTCSTCPLGCLQCVSNNYCVTCLPSYYLNSKSNLCFNCPSQCLNCLFNQTTNSSTCTQCIIGTYFNESS